MRIESSVISISWIPSEAIKGAGTRVPFEMGIAHYDAPLPETVDDLEALRRADAFRFDLIQRRHASRHAGTETSHSMKKPGGAKTGRPPPLRPKRRRPN